VAADARRRGALTESAATLDRAAALSVDPESAAVRRRAAAVAALDGFDFDVALQLVDAADPDDEEAALLGVEAIERRDGESAALGVLAARSVPPSDVLADLLLGTGRRADAAKQLESAPATPLAASLRALLDPSALLPEEPEAIGAVGRRARRRWLQAAAARAVAVAAPTSVDELVSAAHVAGSLGDTLAARDLTDRAVATVPRTATRLLESLQAEAKRFEDIAVTASSVPAAILESLTKAERRVAESVAAGRTNKEVADHLFVSVKTVDFHLQGIYRKLSVRSRTELAVLMAPSLTRGGAGSSGPSGGTS
jgi:DNA-binding NarL/FixJ family response regulator